MTSKVFKQIFVTSVFAGTSIFCQYLLAHVSISNTTSTSEGDRMEIEFRIPHGCGDSDTRQVVISIPPELMANGVATMAKGPWTKREVDTVNNTVTYKGGLLKSEEYTKEYIRGRWPVTGQATTYEFPIKQICNGGNTIDWNNPPPSITVSP